jgi:nitroreductase
MSATREEINRQKLAPVQGLLPALAQRWSPRAFKADSVSTSDLKVILEAARWAASSSNVQPWRFLVGRKGTETYDKIFATLVPFNQSWAVNADVLILGYAELKTPKGDANVYALYDLGQAAASLAIQATALGLHSHPMGGFDHAAAKATFGLTEDQGLGAVIAVGYQDEPVTIANPQVLERELAPRDRKPLSEIALTAVGTALPL